MVKRIGSLGKNSHSPSDIFFLDTNVILYLHHPQYVFGGSDKTRVYSNFIARLRRLGCSLRISSFHAQEAFHVTETLAYENYKKSVLNPERSIRRKEFRKQYRKQVGVTQSSLWNQLKSNYAIETSIIDEGMLETFIRDYGLYSYEPIDYLFTKNHPKCGIITSDADFESDSAIAVYTY